MIKPTIDKSSETFPSTYHTGQSDLLVKIDDILNNVNNLAAKTVLFQIVSKINNHQLFDRATKNWAIGNLASKIKQNLLILNNEDKKSSDTSDRSYGEIQANYFHDVFESMIGNYLKINNPKSDIMIMNSSHSNGYDIRINKIPYEVKSVKESNGHIILNLNEETVKNNYRIILLYPNKVLIIDGYESIKSQIKDQTKINNRRIRYYIETETIPCLSFYNMNDFSKHLLK